jgi:hypothetical protein
MMTLLDSVDQGMTPKMSATNYRRRAVLLWAGAGLGVVGLASTASAAEWISGHYGPAGRWIPGHWVGPGPYPAMAPEAMVAPPGYRPGRVWIPGHYNGGIWVAGHWAVD